MNDLINKTAAKELMTNIDKLLNILAKASKDIPAEIDFVTVGLFKETYLKRLKSIIYGGSLFVSTEKLNKNKLTFQKYSKFIDLIVELLDKCLTDMEQEDKEMEVFKTNYLNAENIRKKLEADNKVLLQEIFAQKEEIEKLQETINRNEHALENNQITVNDLTKKYRTY